MQYLKEEVRKKILKVALEEFYQLGYLQTNMRNVARKCTMTVGNIYRYYKNKEELFVAITSEAYEQIKLLLANPEFIEIDFFQNHENLDRLTDKLLDVAKKYPKELIVILKKSDGFIFETIEKEVETLIARRIMKESIRVGKQKAMMIASLVLHGLTRIFEVFGENPKKMKEEIVALLIFLFYDLEDRVVDR